ncbi:5'-nucleotidase C-terminal domain-containing protein [Mesobacillus maritimus]|uniref:bifunctional metallophosphatase/5'-nucleotidase n=1 Tax=Mesobacillus maritimus TaxID=1643336 RepID=UPI002041FF49|nr:5'-nucleotidase C-terminal domain-containing protein [Mesobacillus maritimus]MCM3670470.1 5'-nucleotidase C-terminal domain-containing protein [Mesobacillus maritimus]
MKRLYLFILSVIMLVAAAGCAGNQQYSQYLLKKRNQNDQSPTFEISQTPVKQEGTPKDDGRDEREAGHPSEQNQDDTKHIPNDSLSLSTEGNVGIMNKSQPTGEGVSAEYHGHISDRPELKNKKPQPPAANNRYKQIQLLGINDLHGQLNVTRRVAGKNAGRVDYLAAYLKQREAENPKNTLYVQAGDMIGASPPVSALLQDEPTIEVLDKLGFDIGTVGNHEFDEGLNELKRLINGGTHEITGNFAGSKAPWVVANVVGKKTNEPILPPYKILKVNGMPVAFIGVVYSETPSIVVPSGVAGLKFTDEVEAINRYIPEIKKQGVKAIVVLAHNPGSSGPNGENPTGELVELAKGVDDEVDIIFGGHNHAYMNATVDNKLLVQSYSYGTAFSDVDIEIDPKTKDIVSKRAEIVTTFHEGIEPDTEISQLLSEYEMEVEPIVNQVIGSTSVDLTAARNENGESIMGNLVADAQRQAMGTDIALMNPGGIRADLLAGDIRWGDIYTVQPFNNDLVKMTMTGQQIIDVLNQQWAGTNPIMLQISGFTYTWDGRESAGNKVVQVQLPDGTSLDPNSTYTVTVNLFLADGGDGFTVFKKGKDREVGPVDLDALVDFIADQPAGFSYEIDGRIKRVDY